MGGGLFRVHFPFPDFPFSIHGRGFSCEECGVDKGGGGEGLM